METIESLKSLLLEKDKIIAQKDAEIKRLSEQCDYHFHKQIENCGDGINARIKLYESNLKLEATERILFKLNAKYSYLKQQFALFRESRRLEYQQQSLRRNHDLVDYCCISSQSSNCNDFCAVYLAGACIFKSQRYD